ncbi:acyl-CoA dehydrogenase family protein [Streptomyces apocyni]|uniref:acyl-CoA dehydrogenase family protein n=1 Tax=Streptomyces apocyni TaxID=2654677 RepID=UPI0012EB0361|nr:acyl-CoA dehydrogenase family protein [Streptomyces apocyni]
MDFQLTDDQRALRAGVREMLRRRFGREALRAAAAPGDAAAPGLAAGDAEPALDRGLWRELGAAGFFSLRLPESEGGAELGLPEAVLVFEEAGRVLLPGPLVATHLAAGEVPGAASGETVVTEVSRGLVPWLNAADVVRRDEAAEGGVVRVAGAVPVRSVDPTTPLHRVPEATGPGTSPVGPLLTAAEQLGSAARTCEMAVQYAKEREQFGQPIGAFQAVKHLCAQMLVRAEVARGAVYAAAVTGDVREIAAAALLADEAAVDNARDCLQVYGGMGFTWEADVHLHLKRAWLRAELGWSAGEAEEMLAAAL